MKELHITIAEKINYEMRTKIFLGVSPKNCLLFFCFSLCMIVNVLLWILLFIWWLQWEVKCWSCYCDCPSDSHLLLMVWLSPPLPDQEKLIGDVISCYFPLGINWSQGAGFLNLGTLLGCMDYNFQNSPTSPHILKWPSLRETARESTEEWLYNERKESFALFDHSVTE